MVLKHYKAGHIDLDKIESLIVDSINSVYRVGHMNGQTELILSNLKKHENDSTNKS